MKFKSILVLFVLFLFVSCKEENPASIKLKVEFDNKLNEDLSRVYSIVVYKNGKSFKKFNRFEEPYVQKETILDSLPYGTYKFVYDNLLGQSLQKTVEVNENKVYNVIVYPDYSDYTNFISKSFVRNLKENQKVAFYFESVGCFHSGTDNLIITKKGNSYFAEREGLSKKLNKKELAAIIKMECELDLMKYGGCTTLDHYIVKCGKEEKEFYDETCKWYGWANMIKQISLKKSKV